MDIRPYGTDDLAAVQRIWREVGWVDEDEAKHLADFVADTHGVVVVPDGADAPEAFVTVHDGSLDHTGTDLPLAVVSSVTASRVVRTQGLAGRGLRRALSDAVGRGQVIAILGMFEQGYYDRSGFGTGAEMLILRTDPAHLDPSLTCRPPQRLTIDDVDDIVACLRRRRTPHGAVTLPSVAMRRAERNWDDNGFGLGYRDDDGVLTHFLWCSAKDEHGPYDVRDWAWRTTDQLRELLGLLRSLGDQVRTVILPEPADLQLQVLVDRPGRMKVTRTTGEHRFESKASAWWQARILDLPACVAALRLTDELRCNLRLTDPLDLEQVAGDWVLQLGPNSTAARGHDDALPTMHATVNAFTRLWLGVRPPSVIAATDGIDAPDGLLASFDDLLRLPRPDVQMDF